MTTTWAFNSSRVVVYFANIAEYKQDGITTKSSQLRKCLFSSDVFHGVAAVIAKIAQLNYYAC